MKKKRLLFISIILLLLSFYLLNATWFKNEQAVYDEIDDSSIDWTLWENWSVQQQPHVTTTITEDISVLKLRSSGSGCYSETTQGNVRTLNLPEPELIKNITTRVKLSCDKDSGTYLTNFTIFGAKVKEILNQNCNTASDDSVWTIIRNTTEETGNGTYYFDIFNDGAFDRQVDITSQSNLNIATHGKLVSGDCGGTTDYSQAEIYYLYIGYYPSNVSILSPADDSTQTQQNITISCFAKVTDGSTIKNVSVYTNKTGTLAFEQGIDVSSSNLTNTTQNFDVYFDDSNSYQIYCESYDSTEDVNVSDTYTIHFGDLTNPNLTINQPTGTKSSLIINYNVSTADNIALNKCIYWVTRGVSTEIANTTVTCASEITGNFSVSTDLAGYTFNFWINDTSANTNYSTSSFSVQTEVGGGGDAGGGGGSSVVIGGDKGWIMQVADGVEKFEIEMAKGQKRKLEIQFENTGETDREIRLSCEDIEGEVCEYITFSENPFTLPATKDIKTRISFEINLPEEINEDDYVFNIRATDDGFQSGTITVYLGVGKAGLFILTLSKLREGIYLLIFSGVFIFSTFILAFALPKKFPIKPFFVIIFSMTLAFLGIYFT